MNRPRSSLSAGIPTSASALASASVPGNGSPGSPSRVAIGYVRVSTDDQTDGWSLDHQRDVIQAWSERHGLPIEQIYGCTDHGESGKNWDRAGWAALIERVVDPQQVPVGWVVVARVDRLTRSLPDLSRLLRDWQTRNICLQFPGDGLENPFDHTSGHMPLLFLGWIAEMERKRMLSRVLPALRARVNAGLPLGRVPFGYRMPDTNAPRRVRDRDGDGDRATPTGYVIHAEEAAVVRDLFARVVAEPQRGLRSVAKWLRERWPQRAWTPTTVGRLLRNRSYTGVLQTTLHPQGRAGSASATQTTVPDAHPALVSESDFTQVQTILDQRAAQRSQATSDANAVTFLGGIAQCGVCGAAITVVREKDHAHYACISRFRSGGRCAAPTLPCERIDADVTLALLEVLQERQQDLAHLVQHAVTEVPSYLDAQRGEAQQVLQSQEAESARLLDAVEQGAMTPAVYGTLRTQAMQRAERARETLAQVDGATYIHRLIAATDPQGGRLRWIPLPVIFARLLPQERRGLVRAAFPVLRLHGVGPQGLEVQIAPGLQAFAALGPGFGRQLAAHEGIDMRRHLERTGFILQGMDADGCEVWQQRAEDVAIPQTVRLRPIRAERRP